MPKPKQQYDFNKLAKRLRRNTAEAIVDFNMIEDGDRVMVCLSGGKDSYTMLDMLLSLQRKAPVKFSLRAVNLDQKQPNFPEHILPEYLKSVGVEYDVIERDTYSVVKRVIPEGKTTCGLCSRLRRGTLYGYAEEHGFNRIALGHHRDDIIETLFLNMFHGGSLQAMPPKLRSNDGRNVVIRPLAYCKEKDIESYALQKQFPIIPCDLCVFTALTNVKPSQLADRDLFDFASLQVDRSQTACEEVTSADSINKNSGSAEPAIEQIKSEEDVEERVLNWVPSVRLMEYRYMKRVNG